MLALERERPIGRVVILAEKDTTERNGGRRWLFASEERLAGLRDFVAERDLSANKWSEDFANIFRVEVEQAGFVPAPTEKLFSVSAMYFQPSPVRTRPP